MDDFGTRIRAYLHGGERYWEDRDAREGLFATLLEEGLKVRMVGDDGDWRVTLVADDDHCLFAMLFTIRAVKSRIEKHDVRPGVLAVLYQHGSPELWEMSRRSAVALFNQAVNR